MIYEISEEEFGKDVDKFFDLADKNFVIVQREGGKRIFLIPITSELSQEEEVAKEIEKAMEGYWRELLG